MEIEGNFFCIQETKNLSTDADNRTDKILERLHVLYAKKRLFGGGGFPIRGRDVIMRPEGQ